MLTKKKKISILAICLVLLSSIMMSGCIKEETQKTATTPLTPQVLTIALARDAKADKIDAATYKGAFAVHPMIYDSLVKYGEGGKILPCLATSWNVSEDSEGHMIITFHLRKGVKFSDGTPFNATAVKFSLERTKIMLPDDKTPVISYLEDIEIVDEYTVKLRYSTYSYPILKQLTFPRPIRIMSPTAVDTPGDPNGTFVKPIGTGPWMLESYVEDQYKVVILTWLEGPTEVYRLRCCLC
jgi:peptide/nickel transport system substrate-binding protein